MQGFINPEKILDQLDLREDMVAAEFGCGIGEFALDLARRLKQGKVYGLDIQEEPLESLKAKANLQRLSNIQTIRCDLEKDQGSTLLSESLDLVLIPNVLFQVEEKKLFLVEAKRVLKTRGKILITDWKLEKPLGPDKSVRVSSESVKELAKELGLEVDKEFDAGSFHWALILVK